MSSKTDWLEGSWQGQLDRGLLWVKELSAEYMDDTGQLTPLWKIIGIPEERFRSFETTVELARTEFQAARGTRGGRYANAECRAALEDLETEERFLKNNWLKMPPLTGAQMAVLNLKVKDSARMVYAAPSGLCEVSAENPQPGKIRLHFRPFNEEAANDRNAQRITYRYGVMPRGSVPPFQTSAAERFLAGVPLGPDDLPAVKTIRKQNADITFPSWYKGMSVYVSGRYENNKGDAGPWSSFIEVIIT